MITKEVAEKLEQANFPRPSNWRDRQNWIEGERYVYAPDLAEIITACGDQFGVLERFKDGTFGAYVPNDIGINGLGDSPQDAVAGLWLAIQGMDGEQ